MFNGSKSNNKSSEKGYPDAQSNKTSSLPLRSPSPSPTNNNSNKQESDLPFPDPFLLSPSLNELGKGNTNTQKEAQKEGELKDERDERKAKSPPLSPTLLSSQLSLSAEREGLVRELERLKNNRMSHPLHQALGQLKKEIKGLQKQRDFLAKKV